MESSSNRAALLAAAAMLTTLHSCHTHKWQEAPACFARSNLLSLTEDHLWSVIRADVCRV